MKWTETHNIIFGGIIPAILLFGCAVWCGGNRQEWVHIEFNDGSVQNIPVQRAGTSIFNKNLNIITKRGRDINYRLDSIKSWYTEFK